MSIQKIIDQLAFFLDEAAEAFFRNTEERWLYPSGKMGFVPLVGFALEAEGKNENRLNGLLKRFCVNFQSNRFRRRTVRQS